VPRSLSVEKNRPVPPGPDRAIVYLDNFDEIRVVQRVSQELSDESDSMSEYHRRFIEVCDQDGLPRSAGISNSFMLLSVAYKAGSSMAKEAH